jgi:eukaryotic-like serine/threonine-protein kinase
MSEDSLLGGSFTHYRIVDKIGEGGMGEVYRAYDSRLDRYVAIKLLPSSLAGDAERLTRFKQEARATSALNHPNILTIYDIGESDGKPFMVTELLEGTDLRQLLSEGPLPLRKVTEYASQIVSGLSAAHEKGVVHRDLKPENVFITSDERVKILDFGLAKIREPNENIHGSEDATRKAITDPGMVMGTAGYMSPEQVRGRPADHRSDIFSFGVILYEMLTGSRAFRGDSLVELMNAILKEDVPEIDDPKVHVPPALDKIMRRCLEKKPEHRFHSAHDLGLALEALSMSSLSASGMRSQSIETAAAETPTGNGRRIRFWQVAFCASMLATVALAILLWAPWGSSASAEPPKLIPLSFEPGGQGRAVWSPDGKAVAYFAKQKANDKVHRLFVRYMDSPMANQIAEIDAASLALQWTVDGRIIFSSARKPEGLWSVPAVGGEPEPLLALTDASIPGVSRDGATAAFLKRGADGMYNLWISSPIGTEPRPYDPAPFATPDSFNSPEVQISENGKQIVLIRNDGNAENAWIMPYPPDPSSPPRRIFESLKTSQGTPDLSWMPDNRHVVVAYTPIGSRSQLALADTVSGRLHIFSTATTNHVAPSVSPDGNKIVFLESITDRDVVSINIDTGAVTPLISSSRSEDMPSSATRSDALVYVTDRNGSPEIWLHRAGQPDRPVVTSRDFPPNSTQWLMGPILSPDGTRVAYSRIGPGGKDHGIWVSSTSGGTPIQVVSGNVYTGSWSPDGTWITYQLNQDGKRSLGKARPVGQARPEILVEDIGGTFVSWPPVWSPSGEWILYFGNGVKLVSIDGKTTRGISEKSAEVYGFSPDGKTIYGIRKTANTDRLELFSVPTLGGAEKVIAPINLEYAPTAGLSPSRRLTFNPDGKTAVYSVAKFTSNLWLMDGLDGIPRP